MYEYPVVLYVIFIKILGANNEHFESFGPGVWLAASKDLENKSDELRTELCAIMKLIGLECGEKILQDMRTFFIHTEKVRKSTRLYDFFALNFLHRGIVRCLKDAVTAISTASDGVKCVFKPFIELVELLLKMTLGSVKLVRRVHLQTKDCLVKHPRAETSKCLIELHATDLMEIVRSLVQLLRSVIKGAIFISGGVVIRTTLCRPGQESLQEMEDMTATAAKFGKCILCVFRRICK